MLIGATCLAIAALLFLRWDRQPPPRTIRLDVILRLELKALRLAIVRYHDRHAVYPPLLRDLVSDGVIRAIPVDPITRRRDSWKPTIEERIPTGEFTSEATERERGIIDVHSGATGSDPAGKRWSDY